jgi:hypothetical protein
MSFVPSRSDLILYEFKVSKSKRRLSKNGIIFHIPSQTFRVDGMVTTFDDEAQFLRFVNNRKKNDKPTRDSITDL